jgi:nitroreductase
MTSVGPARLSPRMTTDDHPVARAGSSKGAPRPPPARLRCDVGGFGAADLRTLEALARLQLAARRRGFAVVFRGADEDLRDLIGWAGLDDALPCIEGSGLEPLGKAEQREQPLGVEEEADPHDRPA